MDFYKDDFLITTDPDRADINAVHRFLSHESYWAKGISTDRVARSIRHSLCFSLMKNQDQIGFARVITDYSTSAYLCDVFILPGYRGLGLSKWLMETIVNHPELQGLRRWTLSTADAHSLYRQFGFTELSKPERFMERFDPDAYTR